MVVKELLATGVGFTAEAIQHRRNKKASETLRSDSCSAVSRLDSVYYSEPPPHFPDNQRAYELSATNSRQQFVSRTSRTEEKDESPIESKACGTDGITGALWQLDEAAEQTDGVTGPGRATIPRGIGKEPARISILVDAFLSAHRPCIRQSPAQLPYPVIIPQRRPESRHRGFVRAYAPCLAPCGISQDTFMQFHDFHDEALRYSNVIKVISVGAAAAGFAPSLTAQIVSLVVGAAAKTAASLQSRQRTNDFLSLMNTEYFMPIGLVCLVMKYSHAGASQTSSLDRACSQVGQNSRWNFNNSHGEKDDDFISKAAPLVFPQSKNAAGKDRPKAIKRAKRFTRDYMDRRAHAEFLQKNPDSQLSRMMEDQIKFESSLGDPRSLPSFSKQSVKSSVNDRLGHLIQTRNSASLDLISALTSEKILPWQGMTPEPRSRQTFSRPGLISARDAQSGQDLSIVDRLKKKDILYLAIFPLPTQEQIQAVQSWPDVEVEDVQI